ncbi:G-type lectin S-receptor-like serine/threonine-protein kinase RKS1 isoform X2 [Salvia hispanica]|uniref:G-type lectin S-receptor-like serine/threonine-protein kinase RKS1 isoform X2 n=1 Tax=Salvia hispanica TaxID=49212 RepID=UPI002009646D|nr:G-type lectin S-receptor-like serine/threonine-protein kinase RKS1 isoform X2 [Salvia hispanica]
MYTPTNTSVTVMAHIYIKIEASHNRKLLVVELVVSVSAALILSFLCFRYIWPKLKTIDSGETNQNLLLLDLNSDGSFTNKEGEDKHRWHKLPIFSLGSITASTNNFSITNKLGQGGFGPVYKGELANGQFVAVKRLSQKSRQGLEEFRNEMHLIAKLQHRNLVRIFGCCDEKDEMILVYEYMPNKSLDYFLFEPSQKDVIDWNKRIHIISGIAQGLMYLHQYSQLRIVHRDLKASNILLDAEMNPKISDFGLARIFGGNESQENTKRIVGTYGYMSPEYAMEGLFSVKSDVFAFGVLMLEIISGKKNTGVGFVEERSC